MSRLVLIVTLCIVTSLRAQPLPGESLSFALIHVPGIMEPENTDAPYNKLLEHIESNSELNVISTFLPYSRAEMLMEKHQIDCLFPVLRGAPNTDFPTLYSDTINVVSVHLFSLHKTHRSLAEIENETVIYLEGYNFGYWGLKDKDKVAWVPVGSQKRALDVLQSGRATAYIDYFPDITLSLSNEAFSRLKYSPDHPIRRFEDSMECIDSDKNRVFMNWFNHELGQLQASGGLKKLLADYYNH